MKKVFLCFFCHKKIDENSPILVCEKCQNKAKGEDKKFILFSLKFSSLKREGKTHQEIMKTNRRTTFFYNNHSTEIIKVLNPLYILGMTKQQADDVLRDRIKKGLSFKKQKLGKKMSDYIRFVYEMEPEDLVQKLNLTRLVNKDDLSNNEICNWSSSLRKLAKRIGANNINESSIKQFDPQLHKTMTKFKLRLNEMCDYAGVKGKRWVKWTIKKIISNCEIMFLNGEKITCTSIIKKYGCGFYTALKTKLKIKKNETLDFFNKRDEEWNDYQKVMKAGLDFYRKNGYINEIELLKKHGFKFYFAIKDDDEFHHRVPFPTQIKRIVQREKNAAKYNIDLEEHKGLIHKVIKKEFYNLSSDLDFYEDMFSAGMIGLINALEQYDPQKNGREIKWSTYAWNWVRGIIGRTVEKENPRRMITIPTHRLYDAEFDQTQYDNQSLNVMQQDEKTELIETIEDHSFDMENRIFLKEIIKKIKEEFGEEDALSFLDQVFSGKKNNQELFARIRKFVLESGFRRNG